MAEMPKAIGCASLTETAAGAVSESGTVALERISFASVSRLVRPPLPWMLSAGS